MNSFEFNDARQSSKTRNQTTQPSENNVFYLDRFESVFYDVMIRVGVLARRMASVKNYTVEQ